MSPSLVVFDVDGTLVDSQAHIMAAMEAAFAAVGRPVPPRATALSVVGLSLPLALRSLVPGAPEQEAEAMVAAYRDTFRSLGRSGQTAAPLFPGTSAMLEALAAEKTTRLGLATGKSRRGLEQLLEIHGLAARFVTRQVADDHPSKPHPSMLLAALRDTGAEAGQAVMVGDTEYDIEMGRAAGFRTVAVAWGYHARERLAGADAVIESWGDLAPALAGFGRAA